MSYDPPTSQQASRRVDGLTPRFADLTPVFTLASAKDSLLGRSTNIRLSQWNLFLQQFPNRGVRIVTTTGFFLLFLDRGERVFDFQFIGCSYSLRFPARRFPCAPLHLRSKFLTGRCSESARLAASRISPSISTITSMSVYSTPSSPTKSGTRKLTLLAPWGCSFFRLIAPPTHLA